MDPTRDPVGFHLGPQPLEVDGLDLDVNSSSSSHPDQVQHETENETGAVARAITTPDELLHFLDSLTPSPPVTGPSSTSLSAQSTPPFAFENQSSLFPEPASSSLGFLLDPVFGAQDQNTQQDSQVKPPSSSSTFATNVKGFDAGDISMPFDLSLPLFDNTAYPVFHSPPSVHYPLAGDKTTSSTSTVPLGSGVDPVALDSTLDSPLASSQGASPWSEILASPMFSLPPDSGTFSEASLPPIERSNETRASFESSASLFPPLPTPPTSLPYDPSTTALRPLPPFPVRPNLAPVQPIPVASPASSSMALPTPPLRSASSSSDSKVRAGSVSAAGARAEPTGFRTTIPLLGPDAPIQTRNPVIASSTSRKRKTAGAEKALAKKRALQQQQDGSSTPTLPVEGEPIDPEQLPADIAAQVERKRLQNTMSARKSRARKQAKMQELEEENRLLAEENARLKAQLDALLASSSTSSSSF